MTKTSFAALLGLLLLMPLALAHPHATIVTVNEARCYVVTDGFRTLNNLGNATAAEPEFWIETNGLLEGGEARGAISEETGLPVAGLPYWDLGEVAFRAMGVEPGEADERFEDGETGLQRGPTVVNGVVIPADTQVDAKTWTEACLG